MPSPRGWTPMSAHFEAAPSQNSQTRVVSPCRRIRGCVIEGPTPAATIFALTVPFVWSNSLHTPCKGGVPVGGCTFGTSGSIVMMSPDRKTTNLTSLLAHRYTPPSGSWRLPDRDLVHWLDRCTDRLRRRGFLLPVRAAGEPDCIPLGAAGDSNPASPLPSAGPFISAANPRLAPAPELQISRFLPGFVHREQARHAPTPS